VRPAVEKLVLRYVRYQVLRARNNLSWNADGTLVWCGFLCNIDATKKAAPKLIQKPLHSINNKLFSITRG
jgi:hypothetical protein